MNIDEIDEQLLSILAEDACQSGEKIAKKLNVSAATVRRRIKKLIQAGILHIVGLVDSSKISSFLISVIALDIETGKIESAMETLANNPEVRLVFSTTGRFDIIALLRFRSTEGLASFLRKDMTKIDGIRNSETFICLTVGKYPLVLP